MRRFLSSLPLAAVLAAAAFAYDAAATPSTALACSASESERCPKEIQRKDNGQIYTRVDESERDLTECTTTTTTTTNSGSTSGPVSAGLEVEKTVTTVTETTYRQATYTDPSGVRVQVNCDLMVSI